jgi:hypothetical protein
MTGQGFVSLIVKHECLLRQSAGVLQLASSVDFIGGFRLQKQDPRVSFLQAAHALNMPACPPARLRMNYILYCGAANACIMGDANQP